jgi:hypothetical protein
MRMKYAALLDLVRISYQAVRRTLVPGVLGLSELINQFQAVDSVSMSYDLAP